MEHSAWNTSDKIWRKERKLSWNNIRDRILAISEIKRPDIKDIKSWYLTGEVPDCESMGWDKEHPLRDGAFPNGLLLELWLHPDQSRSNWLSILEWYKKDKEGIKFWLKNTQIIFKLYAEYPYEIVPNGQCFFGELEGKLYKFLFSGNYDFDYYLISHLDKGHDAFIYDTEQFIYKYISRVNKYFSHIEPCPFYIDIYRVGEFIDALNIIKNIDILNNSSSYDFINTINIIMSNPTKFHDVYVDLAKNIYSELSSTPYKKCIEEVSSEKKSLLENILPGATVTLLFNVNNKKMYHNFVDYFKQTKLTVIKDSPFSVQLYGTLISTYVLEYNEINNNDICVKLKLSPCGVDNLDLFFSALYTAKVQYVYACIENDLDINIYKFNLKLVKYKDNWGDTRYHHHENIEHVLEFNDGCVTCNNKQYFLNNLMDEFPELINCFSALE